MPSRRAPAAGGPGVRVWKTSLRQTFRLLPGRLPSHQTSPTLRTFLESEGLTEADIRPLLDYHPERAGGGAGTVGDPRRYRDLRQVYRTVGMVYEEEDSGVHRLRVTQLGKAVLRWLDTINEHNYDVIGKYLAYALSACQLRNPTDEGSDYDASVVVFPFAFIWRAMLALDGKISSDELAREIIRVTNEEELAAAIDVISRARAANDPELMRPSLQPHWDRLIPWMSMASFGWTLIGDKERTGENTGYYVIPDKTRDILTAAATVKHEHQGFDTNDRQAIGNYVERISRAASLPKDVR